jgi:hypothetical protein
MIAEGIWGASRLNFPNEGAEPVLTRTGIEAGPAGLTDVSHGDRVTTMARLLWFLLLFLPATASAGADEWPHPQDARRTADLARQFDLESGMAVLNRLLTMADRYLQEHFDVDGQYRADSSHDGGSGSFHFKWYPEGKSRSSQGFATDGWFEALPHQFSFRFRFSDPPDQEESSIGEPL